MTAAVPGKPAVCLANKATPAEGRSIPSQHAAQTTSPRLQAARCATMGLSCVFSASNRGHKRRRASPTDESLSKSLPEAGKQQVSAKRVSGVANIDPPLTHSNATVDEDDVLSGLFPTAQTDTGSIDGVDELQSIHRHAFFKIMSRDPPDTTSLSGSGLGTPGKIPLDPELPKHPRKVSPEEADSCLQRYHQLVDYFPFVILPWEATAQSLRRTRPFLLLGILCAMSTHDVPLIHQLDSEFRRVVAEKVVNENNASLDLLQGLLIYLFW